MNSVYQQLGVAVITPGYRDLIRRELALILPDDDQERQDLDWAMEWVSTASEVCRLEKPATPPIHLVSYFVLIDDQHVLLVDHINAELWLPTGGHVDPYESPRETVVREASEELGYLHPVGVEKPRFLTATETVGKTSGHTDVSIWYVLPVSRSRKFFFDESEFSSIRWFHRAEIPFERSDPYMRRFLDKLNAVDA